MCISKIHNSKTLSYLLVLLLAATGLYINTLNAGFVYDDIAVVLGDPDVRLWDFGGWESFLGRHVRTLSLKLDYRFFGLSPQGYHIQNIFWHSLSTVLLYTVFSMVLKDRAVSFLGALFFAVHPIHVESVANISNRKDLLCMAFLLLSIISYLKFISARFVQKKVWLFLLVFFWLLALNSKVVAVTLPLLIILYERLFLARKNYLVLKFPFLTTAVFAAGLAGLIYYLARTLNLSDLEFIKTLSGYSGTPSYFSVANSSAMAFWKYLMLMLFPFALSPDHNVTLVNSLIDPVAIFSYFFVAGFIFVSIRAANKYPAVSFGLFWFFINYLPVSNIIPSVYIIADRYMYIPSAGLCLLAAIGCRSLFDEFWAIRRKGSFIVIVVLISLTLVMYAFKTFRYSAVWKSDLSLWSYSIKKYPDSDKSFNSRGNAFAGSGDYAEALSDFDRAISINPKNASAYTNRGVVLIRLEDYVSAIADFDKTISLDFYFAETYLNRGWAYYKANNYPEALNNYEEAIKNDPAFVDPYINKGIVYDAMGDFPSAIENYAKAIKLAPERGKIYYYRGISYGRLGRHESAIKDFDYLISLMPEHSKAYFNRGIAYGTLAQYDKALSDFNKAVSLDPLYAEAFSRRGMLYSLLGKYGLAVGDYRTAIREGHLSAATYYNLGLAYLKLQNRELAIVALETAAGLGLREAVLKLTALQQ
ncbi:MAG: tetratricopeptide repeat protein [Proteobacteria bacterium]|nr:tetratricopeptide repeat protein [Pseudomonadota bacterium]